MTETHESMNKTRSTTLHVDTPSGPRSIRVERDRWSLPISELLRREDLPLNTRCGQRGLCDACQIELVAGRLVHQVSGEVITANGGAKLLRSCEHHLPADAEVRVRVPERSVLAYEPQVVSEFKLNVPRAHDPLFTPIEGDTRTLGVAVDVGTTTVAVLLVDLATGDVVGRASGFNRQVHMADNVLTRINMCSSEPGTLEKMQHAVSEETLGRLMRRALAEAGELGVTGGEQGGDKEMSTLRIGCVVAAGNATMLHLLAGVDPSSMGQYPFTPAFIDHRVETCESIKLLVPDRARLKGVDDDVEIPGTLPNAEVHLLPGAAAYVGADITAGIFASGMAYDDRTCLLVDVGTNGEIVLKHAGRLLGCATAAGPAFEGAGLACGMRAGQGAICHVRLTRHDDGAINVAYDVIGDVKPTGVCGTAYIDFLGEARRVGFLTETGRFNDEMIEEAGGHIIEAEEFGRVFKLADAVGKDPIFIAESDIAVLLQAKGAIGAGILTLMKQAGITPDQIEVLFLAGGFGMHIHVPNAIASGLLPGFAPSQIDLVGNTSLAGAYMAMLDRHALDEIAHIAKQIEMIELNLDPEFEMTYIEQLSLP